MISEAALKFIKKSFEKRKNYFGHNSFVEKLEEIFISLSGSIFSSRIQNPIPHDEMNPKYCEFYQSKICETFNIF